MCGVLVVGHCEGCAVSCIEVGGGDTPGVDLKN